MLAINTKTTMDKLSHFYASPHHAHKRTDRDRNRDRSASLPAGTVEPNNTAPRPTSAASLTGRRLRTRSRTSSSPLLLPHSILSLNSSPSAHLHYHHQHNHNLTNAPASASRRYANLDASSSASTPPPRFVRRRSNPETLDYEKERLKRQQLAEMFDLAGFEGIDNNSRDFNEPPVSGSSSPASRPATLVMLPSQQAENRTQEIDKPLKNDITTPREESEGNRDGVFTTPPTPLKGLRISSSSISSVPNSPKLSTHDRIDAIDAVPPVPSVEPNTVEPNTIVPSASTSTGSKTNSIFFSTSSSFDVPRPQTPVLKPSTPPVSRPSLDGATYSERVRHMAAAAAATDAVASTRRVPVPPVPPIITLPTILSSPSQNHRHIHHENPVKTPVPTITTSSSLSRPPPSHPSSCPSSRPPSRPPSRESSLRYSTSNISDTDDEDGFLPLPSPSPATPVFASPPLPPSIARHQSFPFTTNSQIIPVLPPSSPLLLPLPPNTHSPVPSLSDLPMLGDDLSLDRTRPVLAPANHHHMKDEDLLGKTMGGYRVVRLLGAGAFSRVYLGETVGNEKEKVAIKLIPKERMRRDPRVKASVEREGGVLKFISHPNVVRLLTSMETEHHLCLVLEYVPGGELFDLVERMHEGNDNKGVDEALVKRLFLQLVDAVQWLHENNVVHRDLKLENILVNNPTDRSITQLKITDFGLARIIDPANPTLTTRCGSEEYAAPEIIRNQGYDGRNTDVWALGVILYAMLVGELPFTYAPERGEKVSHLFYKIMKAEVKWPKTNMEGAEAVKGKGKGMISEEAKEVVAEILVRDPERRIKLRDLPSLKWFREENEEAETKANVEDKAEMV